MPVDVSGSVKASVEFGQKPTTGFYSGQSVPLSRTLQAVFAGGTLADQVDAVFAATLAFVASTPQTIDLQALTDAFGAAFGLAKVKLLAVRNLSTDDAAVLTVAPGASNGNTSILGASSALKVRGSSSAGNSGFALVVAPNTAGYAVGGSTKTLDLTPSAHAFSVEVVIAGVKV